ncbi:MAG: hypothetical protein AAF696_29300 [Bacteroidota bacterium]
MSYTLDLEVDNIGNPHFSLDLNVKLSKLTPINGSPELNILNHIQYISFLPPNQIQGSAFILSPANPSELPAQGAQYMASGSIEFYEDGTPGKQYHYFQITLDVENVE